MTKVRRIVVSIQNGLLAEAINNLLNQSGEFISIRAVNNGKSRLVSTCVTCMPDIVLMETSHAPDNTLEKRLDQVGQIRRMVPNCRAVLLCDENTSPQIAKELIEAKKAGKIDAFYYSSITGKYLIAALYAL